MAEIFNLPTKEGQDNQNQILQQIANTLGVTTDALNSAVNLANQSATNAENKIVDVEERFQTLTTEQQQDAEVIDARQGKTSLVANIQDIKDDLGSHKAENVSSLNGAHGLKYEIGDFTPNIKFGGNNADITYAAQAGTYTKIGRLVYFEVNIVLTSKGSSIGNVTIEGLPFVSFNRPRFFLISPDRMNLPTGGQDVKAWIGAHKSNIELYSRRVGSTDIAVTNEQFLNNTALYIAGYYQTI